MRLEARHVLLIAGRHSSPEDRRDISALGDRLEERGFTSTVMGSEGGPDWIELPGLSRSWLIQWAMRGISLPEDEIPELIHVLDPELAAAGLALAERWEVPYLVSITDYPDEDDRIRVGRDYCRGLIVPCDELADELHTGFGVPRRLLSVVRPGISLGTPNWDDESRPDMVAVVGTAGPLTPSSGFATFLAAARRVLDAGVDAEFVIAGQGEDELDLRRRADRLKMVDRVTFADRPAVGLNYWNALDLFCLTSVTPTTGRNLAHAMAHGVASIASEVAGHRDLILPGETGIRVPEEDSHALATAILELLDKPETMRRIGEAGRNLIANDFSLAREADQLSALYAEVLTRTGATLGGALVGA